MKRIKSTVTPYFDYIYQKGINLAPQLIVELGTGKGGSYSVLSEIALSTCAIYIGVDKKIQDFEKCGGLFIEEDDIKFSERFESWCKGKEIESEIDLLFIDTSHLYDHTKREIEGWFPHLSNDCVVFFHDTNLKKELVYKNTPAPITKLKIKKPQKLLTK